MFTVITNNEMKLKTWLHYVIW